MLGWLGHLPVAVLAAVGAACGMLALLVAGRRRRVAWANLRHCFPERGVAWRTAVLVGHFAALGRSVAELAALCSAGRKRLARLIRVTGTHHLPPPGKPVILLAPHLVGLNAGGAAMMLWHQAVTIATPQSSPLAEQVVHRARTRNLSAATAATAVANARANPMRTALAALAAGRPLYYLMDMDFRDRGRFAFVPFLGAPAAATLTALPRLARLADATVLPCVTRMRPWGGYEVEVGAPWPDFPSGDDVADTGRFNSFVGAQARRRPTQYYWVHRRFKTLPPGTPPLYAES